MQIFINSKLFLLGFFIVLSSSFSSCNKESDPDVCAGKTIVINTVADSATTSISTDGKITISASGSSGFMYKLNTSGAYGSNPVFSNLLSGTYTVFVKDAAGCEKSKSVNVSSKTIPPNPCDGTAGPLFTAVRQLLNDRCISCHSGATPSGGRDWTVDCNVISNKDIINNRAVIVGDMPQGGPTLSSTDKQKITAWINAGGRKTD